MREKGRDGRVEEDRGWGRGREGREFLHLIAGHRYQQQSTDPELFHRGYSQLVH
jgi:hypothetical protein